MNGTIIRRPQKKGKPKFQMQVSAGRDENGKRLRIVKTFDTKGEAEKELGRLLGSRQSGQDLAGQTMTLDAWLSEWLKTHVEGLAYYTARRYRSLVEHVRGPLGAIKLAELRALDLERVYGELYGKMKVRTVRNIHGAVAAALSRALKLKLVSTNVALQCTLRPNDTAESAAIEMDDAQRLEAETAGTWLGVIVRLAIDTGARRGELLALRWADLSFSTGRLVIKRALCQMNDGSIFEKSTKTRSTRIVSLSSSTVAFLEMHQESQRQVAALFGPDYRTDLDLIFASPSGDYIQPQAVSNTMRRHTKALGLTGIGIHSLRHSHASMLLSDGVPVAVVSKRLGHSSPATTQRIYSHALPSEELAAAERWERLRMKKVAETETAVAPQGGDEEKGQVERIQAPKRVQ